MNNPFNSGTADVWYSGSLADWWIEYKYIPKLPVRAAITADLSELQKNWLRGRWDEGRNVTVVIGSPAGAVVMTSPGEWLRAIPAEEFKSRLLSKRGLADWIVSKTLRSP